MDEERLNGRQTHGIKSLKRCVKTLGRRTIDRRTSVGKQLATLRADLTTALGGKAEISPQKAALLDEVVLTKLMLDSVNAWLVGQPTLINKRTKSVIAAVRDRNSLVSVLRVLLGDLGLERKAKRLPTLAEYLQADKLKAQEPDVSQNCETCPPETNGTPNPHNH